MKNKHNQTNYSHKKAKSIVENEKARKIRELLCKESRKTQEIASYKNNIYLANKWDIIK